MIGADEYPKNMVHPQYAPSVIVRDGKDYSGTATRFPPVAAVNADEEGYYRSRGYLEVGEAPPMTAYQEYPLMLTHPLYVPEQPPRTEAQLVDGALKTFPVPGTPAQYPPVTVRTPVEEEQWHERGYERPGRMDAQAFDHANEAPGSAGSEYPKWVGGMIMQDPDAPPVKTTEFPKWVALSNGETALANDAADEARLKGLRPEVKPPQPASTAPQPMLPPELAAMRDTIGVLKDGMMTLTQAFATLKEELVAMRSEPAEPSVPRQFGAVRARKIAVVRPNADLLAQARELGIRVDLRWSARKLQAKIDETLAR